VTNRGLYPTPWRIAARRDTVSATLGCRSPANGLAEFLKDPPEPGGFFREPTSVANIDQNAAVGGNVHWDTLG
jgi:hypothetical protein